MSSDAWITALSTYSATREKVLEHRFVADVSAELWRRGVFDFAVSWSEVDNSGYDVILEANGITRHVQLKAMHLKSTTAEFPLQARLETKPCACVVLMLHDARTLAIHEYRWFGAPPGEKLPALGELVGKHTRGDKSARPSIRRLQKKRFDALPGIEALVDCLFGPVQD